MVMFSWGGDANMSFGLAPWLSAPSMTPAEGYFGFGHTDDKLFVKQILWGIFGMDSFGPVVNVDRSSPPYQASHTLSSSVNTGDPHNGIIADSDTPKRDGKPVLLEAWRYLLGESLITDVPVRGREVLPNRISLEQNYPNPFNPGTLIRFTLPEAAAVELAVYDVLGRRVSTLASGHLQSGTHVIPFAAGDLASGVYFYRLRVGDQVVQRGMQILR